VPDPINRTMTPREWLMLVSLSLLWGGSFFFTSVALQALPPLTLVVLRFGLAALVLHLVLRVRTLRMPRDRQTWGAFLCMGLLNNAVPFGLIAWSQTHIASGLAAILNATTPLWTVIVAHVVTSDEKMTGHRLVGVLVGLAGVTVMLSPVLGTEADALGQLAVLCAALSYACAGVYGRRFRAMGVSPLVTAAAQVSASALMLLPLALFVDRPWTIAVPSLPVLGAIAGIAVLSTALAYVLYFRILASAGATNLLLVTFLIPVSAILLGWAMLGEHLDPRSYLGMALIGGGLAAIDGRLLMKRWPRPGAPDRMGSGRHEA
jgi:drug/metabolite transporter (DMT)-like permease